jgi:hypothetical protein
MELLSGLQKMQGDCGIPARRFQASVDRAIPVFEVLQALEFEQIGIETERGIHVP